jgi:glutamate racemase
MRLPPPQRARGTAHAHPRHQSEHDPGSSARRAIEKEIERALAEDGAEAIVLGCAGMADLARDLEQAAGVPVLDGVACAVGLAESLARLGVKTSKRNTYAPPRAKAYTGSSGASRLPRQLMPKALSADSSRQPDGDDRSFAG